MINSINWFEIPVTDLSRAKGFYEEIFGIRMHEIDLANNLKMALFPVEEGAVGGALCQHPDFYKPSKEGTIVYLNGNPDLQKVLDKVEACGGKILVPKTHISDQKGYMAVFFDSEGNRVAVHSVN